MIPSFWGEQAFEPTSLEGEQGRGGHSRQRPQTPGPTFLGLFPQTQPHLPGGPVAGPGPGPQSGREASLLVPPAARGALLRVLMRERDRKSVV